MSSHRTTITSARRVRSTLLAGLVAIGSVALASPAADASTSSVTIKASLGASYRLLAVTKSGKSVVASSSGGKVTLKGLTRTDTSGMTLSVVSKSGAYVGPVMLKYLANKKATSQPKKATNAFIKLKKATKATIDLGSVKTGANFAYATKSQATTGTSVKVTNGVPPARDNFGKGSTASSGGVRSAADPTVNDLGDDPDQDGLVSFADVDDDGDGKLDLVDSTFYQQPVKEDGSNQGAASIFTALICGGNCVNLNAYNVTSPSGAAATRLSTMINTFQGVFFQFRDVAGTFPTRANRDFGYFNVDCTGISWCAGESSKAVTISPDYDQNGSQPAGNALPLASGETNYSALCGANVIAKDPVAAQGPTYSGPANWPTNDAGTGSAFDRTMDEWVFRTCDPDKDGFPNIIPSKGTIASGMEWMNEIKPRMAGPDGMKVGDTIRYNLTDAKGKSLYSSTQVISGVIQTAPSIRSWNGATLHQADGSYNPGSITGMTSAAANPGGTAEITFWRPQRAPIGTETTWQDVGGLTYAFGGGATMCKIDSATTSSGTTLQVVTGGRGESVVVDTANDATPNPANFITMRVSGLSTCTSGQVKLMAMDRAGNTTVFSWQMGNQPGGGGQPQGPANPPNPPKP
ncbi:MAG: hypothetical protein ACKOCC_01555 [Actinomycetota bacterium]